MIYMEWCLLLVAVAVGYGSTTNQSHSLKSFPKDFQFGTASAAYQVEGAWNIDGKGESIWDRFVHTRPDAIRDRSNGDVACDFYHKYIGDIQNLKLLGVHFFRMSISWPRILPYGTIKVINRLAIKHYRDVFTELLKNGIEPMVSIYHWDLPQVLQDKGGFESPEFVKWFVDYARVAFQEFGDQVKIWSTFNEPLAQCHFGHALGKFAPGIKGSGTSDYVCGHNLIKAHAAAYHLYDKEFRAKQKGKVGMVVVTLWAKPATNRKEDIEAAETFNQFMLGWFVHPIYVGDYPKVMKERVAMRSHLEGRNGSRLPAFTKEEILRIRGTHDYFGLNHYTAIEVSARSEPPIGKPDYYSDVGVKRSVDLSWESTCVDLIKVVPSSMREILVFIKERYGNPPVYITENGMCNFGGLEDNDSISYMKAYLSNVIDAMVYDKVDVRRYTTWSYMDSFEWDSGYLAKYGLFYVNFTDPSRRRTPKKSAFVYNQIIKSRTIS